MRRLAGILGGRSGLKAVVLVLAVLACAGLVTAQVRRLKATLARSAEQALARSFGPALTVEGTPEVRLLPRPHVRLAGVRIALQPQGLSAEVPLLEATQSIGSLLTGRLAFSRIRLVSPRVTLDADTVADGAPGGALALIGRSLPGRLVIEDGAVTLQSRHAAARGVLTGVDAVLDGLDRNAEATLTGHGLWRGERLDLSARITPVFDFVLGREASGSLRIRSPVLSASVEGRLRAGIRGGFEGQVAVDSPSVPALLQLNGLPTGLGRIVGAASFSGSGVANRDTVTFSDARLDLDGTDFEGSLAWQPNDGRWAWTGTFATDTLDLTHGLAALPALRDAKGRWSDAAWTLDPALFGDVDLRISASHALLGPITIEDAAFSALCRDGRIEAGFSEARSLNGLIRGRAVAAVSGHQVALRVDLSMSQMDLDPLAQAVGTAGISGSASGHLVAEARGASPRALVESLGGHGQISVRDGSLPALPSVADLSALGLDAPAWLRSRATLPFDLATADLLLAGNRVKVVGGRVVEAGSQQAFTAEASLLDRSFSLQTVPGTAPDTGTSLAGILGTPPRILKASAEDGAPHPAAAQ